MILKSKTKFLSKKKEVTDNITYIDINLIRPNPYQPRKKFSTLTLEELALSIKENGILQPISVRKIGNFYETVAGERRLRASKIAGLTHIPAIVLNIEDHQSAALSLMENLQREDLTFLEEAESYYHLLTDHGYTQEKLAEKLGKSQSAVANKVRILKLPENLLYKISDNNLSERHARALLRLYDQQDQADALDHIIEKKLNVNDSEEYISKVLEKNESTETKTLNGEEKLLFKKKTPRVTRDIRILTNTVKHTVDVLRKAGVSARASQVDRGDYLEFIIRVPKEE